LFKEFRHSILFRVAAAYFVGAWLLIQLGDILLENFAAPDWVFRALVLALIAAFPLVLVVAWFVDASRKASRSGGRASTRLGFFVRLVVVIVMTALLVWLGRHALHSGMELVDAERPPSVAVLPFADMSPDGDQRYFALGLSEEILNLLAGIEALKVSGRTSSFSFEGKDASIPEIGDALGVAHVLEGSVRKSGEQLRVTAQLISAEDGFHVWSQNYERELTDIFAIQDEIADAIASRLRLSLVDDDRGMTASSTSSIDAYEQFLRARQLIQDRQVPGMERARELLDRALALDPDFAPALAQQALAWLMLSDARTTPGSEPLATAITRAESLLRRAREADTALADAFAVEGLLLTIQRQFDRADRSLERALEINPSHSDALNWRAINLRNAGRLRDELQARQQLLDIDPLHLSNLFNLSIAHLLRGQADAAIATARRLKRDFPNSPWGTLAEVEALLGSGRLAEAYVLTTEQLDGGNSILVATAGSVNMRLGRFEEAIEVSGAPFGTALIGLGRIDEAVATAREAAAAAPDNSNSALMLLEVLSLAGRHEALLSHFQARWGSLDALQAYFGFEDGTAEVAPIAAAQAALGQREALAQTLGHWRERLADPAAQGYEMPYYRYIRAGFAALAGERDRALARLEAAIEGGYLTPLLGIDPKFAPLRRDAAFLRLVDRNYERIDAQRAELGLPALERPSLPDRTD
jgi:TolB-like protein/Tfp pilus assembly protein PilF